MEHLLQFVWKHKLFPLTPLHTTQGQTVEVIDPGLPNPDAGPDFFNAKIKIDGILWVGNVEIHVHASDWKRHHHHQDRAYDSVILHVASDIDAETFRTDGTPIPQMELHYPPYLLDNYRELIETSHYPACYRLIPRLPKLLLHSWLPSWPRAKATGNKPFFSPWPATSVSAPTATPSNNGHRPFPCKPSTSTAIIFFR